MNRVVQTVRDAIIACYSRFRKPLTYLLQYTKHHKRFPLVLSVGCGHGGELLLLQYFTSQVIGCDRQAYPEWGKLWYPLVVCDAEYLPFRDGAVEIVMMLECLEHLDVPVAGLQESIRVAQFSVVLTMPNPEGDPKSANAEDHKTVFTEQVVRTIFGDLGLDVYVDKVCGKGIKEWKPTNWFIVVKK